MPETILSQVAAGQPAAVAECLKRYGPLVWSLARRFSCEHSEAEDGVQEVFIDVWKNAGRFDANLGSETTFITTIARRRLIDLMRRRGRQVNAGELNDGITSARPSAEFQFQSREESDRIHSAMQQLKLEERSVLNLALLHGFSQQEISERLELPLGTVKSHARRGLQRLRDLVCPDERGATP